MNDLRTPLKIVMIDDDELMLDSTLSFLTDEGFITTGFTSPHYAMQSIKDNPPDICIIDYRIPDIDGEQLVLQIKQTSPGIRCLIYTGAAITLTDAMRQHGISESDIIQKPITDFDIFISLLLHHR